jgi:hypothetical protein
MPASTLEVHPDIQHDTVHMLLTVVGLTGRQQRATAPRLKHEARLWIGHTPRRPCCGPAHRNHEGIDRQRFASR